MDSSKYREYHDRMERIIDKAHGKDSETIEQAKDKLQDIYDDAESNYGSTDELVKALHREFDWWLI